MIDLPVIEADRLTLGPPRDLAAEALLRHERVIVLRRGGGLMRYDASIWRREYVPAHALVTATEAGALRWVPWLESGGAVFGTFRATTLRKARRLAALTC